MTFPAVLAFLSFVLVVFFMTGIALRRGMFVPILCMTGFACDLRMFALQGIRGLVVIETNVLPCLFRMAIRTGFPHTTFVLVVLLVTAITGGWGITKFRLWLVAGFTVDFLRIGMRATQDKVGV